MTEHLGDTSPTPEHSRPHEMRETVAMLTRDFRNTFKYSQGDPTTQTLLTTLVRDSYGQTDETTREQIPRALAVVDSQVGRFVVPSKHIKIDDAWNEYAKAFHEFRKCLVKLDYMPNYVPPGKLVLEPLPTERDERLDIMLDRIAMRDLRFIRRGVGEGRPNREVDSERYESHLRTYILGGQDTYSDAFNTIFRDAHQQLVTSYPQTGLGKLQEEWEYHHPEQEFYPPAFMEEVEEERKDI